MTFSSITGHWLFNIRRLAGLAYTKRVFGMGTGRSGNIDNVHFGIVNQLTGISVELWHIVPAGIVRRFFSTTTHYGLQVASGDFRKSRPAFDFTNVAATYDTVQDLIGKPFMRGKQPEGVTKTIARVTRVKREKGMGMRSASVRDWHALRTTFVTLALSAGVPLELVRRVTGHATADIVLKHYFRPDRKQFRAALIDAMPDVITGKETKLIAVDETTVLAQKLVDGKATVEDKKKLIKLLRGEIKAKLNETSNIKP